MPEAFLLQQLYLFLPPPRRVLEPVSRGSAGSRVRNRYKTASGQTLAAFGMTRVPWGRGSRRVAQGLSPAAGGRGMLALLHPAMPLLMPRCPFLPPTPSFHHLLVKSLMMGFLTLSLLLSL